MYIKVHELKGTKNGNLRFSTFVVVITEAGRPVGYTENTDEEKNNKS